MKKHTLVGAIAALLCGSLTAQINIPSPGWTVFPQSQLVYNPFFVAGAGPNDFIMGGCVAQVGTSITGSFVNANASFQGFITGGPQITGGCSALAVRTESYSRSGTGTVSTTLTASANPASFIVRVGAGYRGVANATVSANCPAFAPVQASCQVRGVQPPQGPILMTLPVTATATVAGQSSWWIAMYAASNTTGTMSGTNGQLQMNAICDVNGTVVLN